MRALHIGAQIAERARARRTPPGIIHRDLKPDNIMLMPRLGDPDFVKVLDFGLAKMFAGRRAANLTAHGVLLGHAAVHVARGVRDASATSITAPTSTRSASCCSRC